MVEKEIKALLDREQYDRLNKFFHWNDCFVQVNHYYADLEDPTVSERCIRIREKNGKRKLQIKLSVETKNSLHVKMEYEKEIDAVKERLDRKELEELSGAPFERDLFHEGYLKTERKVCNTYKGIEICLDKNEYLGKTDYEVEIEFLDDYPWEIVLLLNSLAINVNHYTRGKYKRFKERKRSKGLT